MDPARVRFLLDAVGLPSLRLEQPITARVIAALPPDRIDFAPAPGGRSAGELARHIIAVEIAFLEGAVAGAFPDVADELPPGATPAELAAWYTARAGAARERLAGIEGAQLLAMLDYKGVVRMPALGFVQFAVNHSIHHRGQLSVYLRAMGVAVPSIYG